eukprot:Lankesteria_metandrocarpae@DN9335_c0_g1_i1.p1
MRLLGFSSRTVSFEFLDAIGNTPSEAIIKHSLQRVHLIVHSAMNAILGVNPYSGQATAQLRSTGSDDQGGVWDQLLVCSDLTLPFKADTDISDIENRHLAVHLHRANVEIWHESPLSIVLRDDHTPHLSNDVSVTTASYSTPNGSAAATSSSSTDAASSTQNHKKMYRLRFEVNEDTASLVEALRSSSWTVLCGDARWRQLPAADTGPIDKERGNTECSTGGIAEVTPNISVKVADKSMPDSSAPRGHLDSMEALTVSQYFQYYGKMANQMNMLQDSVRTSAYRDAILKNSTDFYGKTVMDVGAGSGILSFFAATAGAQRVYAVEASSMAQVAEALAVSNQNVGAIPPNVIQVLKTTVEGLKLSQQQGIKSGGVGSSVDPEEFEEYGLSKPVDILISEPVGTFLFNERMLESFLYARDHFLKPGGSMYPDVCYLYIAPFSDQNLYADMSSRHSFWQNSNFYGLNLTSVAERAINEVFAQPVVDCINPAVLVAPAHVETFDFRTIHVDSLQHIVIPFHFQVATPCVVHGIAGWFDIVFRGPQETVTLSTSPLSPATHWYQIRFLFRQPLALNPSQVLTGVLEMTGNKQQSYYVYITAEIAGTDMKTSSVVIDLKDPDYRYYSNPQYSYYPAASVQQQASPVQIAGGTAQIDNECP